MRQVFTDDVVIDTTASGGGIITGADEFIAFLEATLGEATTVHHGHMPEIQLTSPTTATAIWALQDLRASSGCRGPLASLEDFRRPDHWVT